MKNLIIVESPAKAKTIKNFLGKDYEVIASKGHVRDLPKTSFGIEIKDNVFTPQYRIQKDHSKLVSEIKALAKKSDTIFIATDEDREGEAIGYHIATAIGKDPQSLPRIVFHEITKTAIQNALKNPRQIDIKSFDAQQTRRLLDRIVGYKLSPLLGSKIQKGLSAGRVQSSALKIVVDKEREIQAFKSVEFWSIDAKFNGVDSILVEFLNEKIDKMTITNGDRAKFIQNELMSESFFVSDIQTKQRKTPTPPPFMTSSLQQSASSVLGFSPKKTMMLAQSLYEGVKTHKGESGVITYMRTDSLNISKEAIKDARELIQNQYGEKYLPKKANVYTTKSKGAQEAHEAIRPTMLDFTPVVAQKYLEKDALRLYTLIYNRFLASQMTEALFESQSVAFTCKKGSFKASGRKLVFDGFYKVYGDSDKDKLLPNFELNQQVSLDELHANQHFTEPPSRFSEASLIKMLESLGIGRPSTYAPTISILSAREYIQIEKKKITPTPIAFTVIELLEKHFSQIVDSHFTSSMEENLDEIAEGKKQWQNVLGDFYEPFMKQIDEGKTNIVSQKVAIPTGEKCPQCGSELVQRKGRFGEFIACSAFPKCKYSKNLEQKEKKELIKLDIPCPKCGGDVVQRSSRRGKFYGCGNYPKCKFISTYELVDKKCDSCGGAMVIKHLKAKDVYECLECKQKVDA